MPKHRFFAGRLFEWMTAMMMIGMATVIAANPNTVRVGGFYLMTNVGLTAPILAVLFTFAGCVRVSALFANGLWALWGPRFRALCALIGASLWAQMAIALTAWSAESGYVSVGVPVYAFLTIGELISCYRAATDGKPRNT
jgi:hypothetical protein